MCCFDSYMGRQRTTIMLWLLQRWLFDATGVGLGYIKCCNGYMGRLRSVRVLWWLMGWA